MSDPVVPIVVVAVEAIVVPAHNQKITHHYTVRYPDHSPRASDPHYAAFNAFKKRTKAQAVCYVGARFNDFSMCVLDKPLEVHHTIIEFAIQNSVDLKALQIDFPEIQTEEELAAFVESDRNFVWYCATPESLILMGDGSQREIAGIEPGDHVVGKDGQAHVVTATGRRRYRGDIIRLGPSVALTPEHSVLTQSGWTSAGKIANEFGMVASDVIRVRGVESEILRSVVGSVPINVVHAFGRQKGSPEYLFHDLPMLHDESHAIPHPDITSRLVIGCSMAEVRSGQAVQGNNPASVGAESLLPRSPIRMAGDGLTAEFAVEGRTLGWLSVNKPIRSLYSGWVHDLSIAHSHSFIAGGIVVHNCQFHHRGHGGAHTASAADFEAQMYVKGLIT